MYVNKQNIFYFGKILLVFYLENVLLIFFNGMLELRSKILSKKLFQGIKLGFYASREPHYNVLAFLFLVTSSSLLNVDRQ